MGDLCEQMDHSFLVIHCKNTKVEWIIQLSLCHQNFFKDKFFFKDKELFENYMRPTTRRNSGVKTLSASAM